MAAVAGPRPPFGVHSSGPVSSPSGVQPSAVRPSGVRCPASDRLVSALCPVASVFSRVSRWWLWESRRCGGQPSRLEQVEFPVVCRGPRAARSTARVGLDAGDAAKLVRRSGRSVGRVGRGTGRWCLGGGGGARPLTDQGGQTAARGRASLAAWPGTGGGGSAPFLSLPRGRPSWAGCATTVRGCRGAWRTEWTGPEGPMSLTVGWSRGPSAAQPVSGCSQRDANNALTSENGGGRDRV